MTDYNSFEVEYSGIRMVPLFEGPDRGSSSETRAPKIKKTILPKYYKKNIQEHQKRAPKNYSA